MTLAQKAYQHGIDAWNAGLPEEYARLLCPYHSRGMRSMFMRGWFSKERGKWVTIKAGDGVVKRVRILGRDGAGDVQVDDGSGCTHKRHYIFWENIIQDC